MLSLSPKTPHSRPVTRLNQALLPSETWTCRPAPAAAAAAAGAPSHYTNFYRELKASLPLCSPRKTSLNFLKGFPKSLPTDILKRRKKRGGVRTRCSWARSHSSSEKMLDGKGGGAASRSLSLFVMRTHTHTLLLHRSVTLWLSFFSPPLCACVVPSSWYKMTSWASVCREGAAGRRFDVFRVQHEVRRHWHALRARANTLQHCSSVWSFFRKHVLKKCQKEKKTTDFFVSSFIRKLFYFVLWLFYFHNMAIWMFCTFYFYCILMKCFTYVIFITEFYLFSFSI